MYRGTACVGILIGFAAILQGSSKNQEFSDFTTPLPLQRGNTLVLGVVGGWERWDAPQRGVRKTALELRALKLPGLYVETVENHKLELAEQLIDRAFPRDAASTARIVIYGHSFGAMSAVRLARDLNDKGIPVLLLILVDAVGRNRPIPPNVKAAANYFQREGCPICGAKKIVAEDPHRTRIIGNFEWKYRHKNIDIHGEPWIRRTFVRSHEKMEFDPEMWASVKKLILDAIH